MTHGHYPRGGQQNRRGGMNNSSGGHRGSHNYFYGHDSYYQDSYEEMEERMYAEQRGGRGMRD